MGQQLSDANREPDAVLQRCASKSGTPWSFSPFAEIGENAPTHSQGGSQNPLARDMGKGRRILIIEDDPSSRELYDLLLQAFGFATNLAVNGEAGLVQARSFGPDLILCDIRLPGLNGVEVMQRLKADPFFRGIPIIALTIYSSQGQRERLLAAGFDGYLAKPTIPEDFIREIQNFLPPNKGE